ncbi:hypothetical protein HK104_001509 [Borealophlyctis nickersoniae]|nr:hypothetical protein HK104_001509 [Borealophlyctis nickersoniae]
MPITFIAYLLSIVDRSNVSYAKIANAETRNTILHTVGMTNEQFSVALAAFFVGYIVFEIPSNLILKKVSAPVWFARIMITWGIVTTLQVLVKEPWHFTLLRFLLGACEAGFFPGVVYYLTFWYRKQEAARRIAAFYIATTVAGVIGGAWAYGVQMMNRDSGYYGWQWLFLTSGVPTIAVGCIIWYILPNTPESVTSTWWITPAERELAIQRLRVDGVARSHEKIEKAEVLGVFLDIKNWMFVIMYSGTVMCANALGLFLPTIIFMLGYKSLDATKMSIAPYAAATVLTLLIAHVSDRTRSRAYPLIATSLIAVVGFTVLVASDYTNRSAKYGGAIIATSGVFASIPIVFGWLSNNLRTSTTAATAIALVSSVGNLGSVVASSRDFELSA